MILSILQGPTDYYQYIHIDVKRRYNESDHFFRLFFERKGLRETLAGLELHADSHYLRRRGVCEEGFFSVITWTRKRLFLSAKLLHYTFTLSSYYYSLDLESIGTDDDRSLLKGN